MNGIRVPRKRYATRYRMRPGHIIAASFILYLFGLMQARCYSYEYYANDWYEEAISTSPSTHSLDSWGIYRNTPWLEYIRVWINSWPSSGSLKLKLGGLPEVAGSNTMEVYIEAYGVYKLDNGEWWAERVDYNGAYIENQNLGQNPFAVTTGATGVANLVLCAEILEPLPQYKPPVVTLSANGVSTIGGASPIAQAPAGSVLTLNMSATDDNNNYECTWLWVKAGETGGWNQIYNSTSPTGSCNYTLGPLAQRYYFKCRAIDDTSAESRSSILIVETAGSANSPPVVTIGAGTTKIRLGEPVALNSTATDADANMNLHSFYLRGSRTVDNFGSDSNGWIRDADSTAGWSNFSSSPGVPTDGANSSKTATYTPPLGGYWQFMANARDMLDAWGNGPATATVFVAPLPSLGVTASTANGQASASAGGTLNVYVGETITINSSATALGWLSEHNIYGYTPGPTLFSIPGGAAVLSAGDTAASSTRTVSWTPSSPGTYTIYAEAFTGKSPSERINGVSGWPGYAGGIFGGYDNKRITVNVRHNPTGSIQVLDSARNPVPFSDGVYSLVRGNFFYLKVKGSDPDGDADRYYTRITAPDGALIHCVDAPRDSGDGYDGCRTFGPFQVTSTGNWHIWGHVADATARGWGSITPWNENGNGWFSTPHYTLQVSEIDIRIISDSHEHYNTGVNGDNSSGSWLDAPFYVNAGEPYTVDTGDGIVEDVELYRNGIFVAIGNVFDQPYYMNGDGEKYGVHLMASFRDTAHGEYTYAAYIYHYMYPDEGEWLETTVTVGNYHTVTASVSVDGYPSKSTITRTAENPFPTITVRFKASDPAGDLCGIRPNVAGTIESKNGEFLPISGADAEIVRTYTLDKNGYYFFWADAQDETRRSVNEYSSSWNGRDECDAYWVHVTTAPVPATVVFDEISSGVFNDQNVTGHGWAADFWDGAPVKQVEVWADGSFVKNATLRVERPDVESAFNRPDWRYSGFNFEFPAAGMLPGSHIAEIRACGLTISRPFSIGNRPPVASISSDKGMIRVGESVMFTVSGTDPDGNLTSINLDRHGGGYFDIGADVHVYDGVNTPNDGAMTFSERGSANASHSIIFSNPGVYQFQGAVDDAVLGWHDPGYSSPVSITVESRAKMQLWLEYFAPGGGTEGQSGMTAKGNFWPADYDNTPDRGILNAHAYHPGNAIRLRPVLHMPDGFGAGCTIRVTDPVGNIVYERTEKVPAETGGQWLFYDNIVKLFESGRHIIEITGIAEWTSPNPETTSVTYYLDVAPDTQPPTAPANLSATNITTNACALTWSASTDNAGVVYYEILNKGTIFGVATNDTSIRITGLAPGTNYNFSVRAWDYGGNVSDASNLVSVNTLPPAPVTTTLPADWAALYGLSVNAALSDANGDGFSNFANYNLGRNPVATPTVNPLVNTLPAAWASLVAPHTTRTEAVGTTTGALSVDKSGAASYAISIFVVPGTSGMQPAMSLVYSSHANGGIAGHGWSLGGLSAITRGPQTKSVDNAVHGIDFTRDDAYYLDGQRLILVSGSHGYSGAEYRTEIETFAKIVAQGSAGNGTQSFKVWTKSGRLLEYGTTNESRLLANSSSHQAEVQKWALVKTTDTNGNYMIYTYAKNHSTGEQWLTRIDYTGNTSAGLSPYASLRFTHDTRLDTAFGYVHGAKFSSTQRLKTIRACYGETTVRTYTLNYIEREPSKRSLLASITETGIDGKSLPPTTFDYTDPSDVWESAQQYTPPVRIHPANTIFADINGDALPDCISGKGVWLNTGSGWSRTSWNLPASYNDKTAKLVDINFDGLVDIMTKDGDAYINNGDGFTLSSYWSLANAKSGTHWDERFTPGSKDIFGDIVVSYTRKGIRLLDANGDGRPECIIDGMVVRDRKNTEYYYDEYGVYRELVYYIRTSHHASEPYINRSSEGAAGYRDAQGSWVWQQESPAEDNAWQYSVALTGLVENSERLLDLNGDGLPDRFTAKGMIGRFGDSRDPDAFSCGGWHSYIDHTLFLGTHPCGLPVDFLVQAGSDWQYTSVFVDLNNDGLVDLVRRNIIQDRPYANGNEAWFNTGDGWVRASSAYESPFVLAEAQVMSGSPHTPTFLPQGVAFMDINNDGLVDIVRSTDSDGTDARLGKAGGGWSATSTWTLPWPIQHSGVEGSSGIPGGNFSGADFVDINGDGAVDVVWNSNLGSGAMLNKRVNPDRLCRVTNGLGTSDAITYSTLSDPEVYSRTGAHPASTQAEPIATVTPGMYVVKVITHDSSSAQAYNIAYSYANYRAHRTRGGRGFETMVIHDARTGSAVVHTYSQLHPSTGSLLGTSTIAPGNITVAQTAYTYAEKSLVGANGNTTVFVYPAIIESAGYELDGTLRTLSDTIADYDDFGNPTTMETTSGIGNDIITSTTENTYSNDTTRWILGRLTGLASTTTQGASSITRAYSFTYDTTTGQLLTEIAEPDRAEEESNMYLNTEYSYNIYGNRTEIKVTGGGISATRKGTTTYDGKGRFVTKVTNACDHTQTFNYGITSAQILNQALGLPVSTTGPNGLTTSYGYDGFGRSLSETRAYGTVTTNSFLWAGDGSPDPDCVYYMHTQSTGEPPVLTCYDRRARATTTLTLNPADTSGAPRIVIVGTEYDSFNRPFRTSLPAWYGDTLILATETTYDVLGRPLSVSRTDEDQPGGMVTITYAYAGRAIEITDPKGRVERAETDIHGRTIRRLNNADASFGSSERGEVTYEYDPAGNLAATHAHREDGSVVTTTLGYDLLGRKTSMTDPDTGTWTYTYNALGELLTQIDAKNQKTTMTYDALGRLLVRSDFDSSTSWTYDSATYGKGKLGSVTHTATGENPVVESYTYDALGSLRTHTRRIDNNNHTTTYAYDDAGRLLTIAYPGATGFRVRNDYTAFGFLMRIRADGGATGLTGDVFNGQILWQVENHDPSGAITTAILGNGLTQDRIISTFTGRVKAISASAAQGIHAATPAMEQLYIYDEAGQLTRRTDEVLGIEERYAYDGLNRLTSYASTSNLNPVASVALTYDALGNITEKSDVGRYSYHGPHAHAVTAVNSILLGHQPYAHDANGNTLSGAGRAYEYTAANKVRKITQGAKQAAFTLDAARQRVTQTRQDGSRTTYVSALYEKHLNGTTGLTEERHYIHTPLGRSVLRTVRSDMQVEVRYLHADALGTVHSVSDQYGRVEKRFTYDPWGRQTAEVDTHAANGGRTTRGYTDHEMLDDLTLIHMNARVFDPALGRFLVPDAIVHDPGISQCYNRYSYCINNPVNASDPTGNDFWFDDDDAWGNVPIYIDGVYAGSISKSSFEYGDYLRLAHGFEGGKIQNLYGDTWAQRGYEINATYLGNSMTVVASASTNGVMVGMYINVANPSALSMPLDQFADLGGGSYMLSTLLSAPFSGAGRESVVGATGKSYYGTELPTSISTSANVTYNITYGAKFIAKDSYVKFLFNLRTTMDAPAMVAIDAVAARNGNKTVVDISIMVYLNSGHYANRDAVPLYVQYAEYQHIIDYVGGIQKAYSDGLAGFNRGGIGSSPDFVLDQLRGQLGYTALETVARYDGKDSYGNPRQHHPDGAVLRPSDFTAYPNSWWK